MEKGNLFLANLNNCELFVLSYDSFTGVFTVPPGGDGVYYFSLYLLVDDGEGATFDMRHNNDVICTTWPDHNHNGDTDYAPGSCSAVVDVVAGKRCLSMHYKIQSNSCY